MRAYSEDLRKKIVAAIEQRGMSKAEAARTFDVSLSSVKRYARTVRQGDSLTPKWGAGRPRKLDKGAQALLPTRGLLRKRERIAWCPPTKEQT